MPTLDPSATRPAPNLDQPTDPKVARFHGLTAPKPAMWMWQPPTEPHIAEYVVPGVARVDQPATNQARITVTQAGGTLEMNIKRWQGQFRDAQQRVVEPKIHEIDVNGMKVTLIEFAGEYRGMGGIWTQDQLFITAMLQPPAGQLFIRLVGQTATVEANRPAFMDMIKGLRPYEPEK